MTAYYNEIEPYAARWLRNLIAAGHIAPGDVDERSIEDVTPTDLAGYTQCHFFAGIGVWSYALRMAGWPDDRRVWTGSCPCQPFSQAGKGGGVADERHLWPAWYHLIDLCRPPAIFGEQVASPAGLGWFDLVQADLERSGYAVGAADLCAAGVGAPHIRQRLYFAGTVEHPESEQVGISGCSWEPRGPFGELADNDGERQPQRAECNGESLEPEQPAPRRNDAGRCGGMGDDDDEGLEGRSLPAGGCTDQRTAWTPSDFVWCRDGKWRPVESVAQQMADGSAERLGCLRSDAIEKITKEVADAFRCEDDARKAVFALRKAVAAKALEQRGVGRLLGVRQAPILFAFMLQLKEQRWVFSKGLSRSGKEAAWAALRSVRSNDAASCSSCQRGLDEQRPDECSNPVHLLSSILARHAQENWGEAFDKNAALVFPLITGAVSRVGRLRAYGNAIVAPLAKEFIAAYMECRP